MKTILRKKGTKSGLLIDNINNVELEVSRDVREMAEHLFWVLGELPENISTAATRDSYTIFNLKTDKRLILKVSE